MLYRDPSRETGCKPRDSLGRQSDLGNENDPSAATFEHGLQCAQVDLGFPAAGNTVQYELLRAFPIQRLVDRLPHSLLIGRQDGCCARNEGASRQRVAVDLFLFEPDQTVGLQITEDGQCRRGLCIHPTQPDWLALPLQEIQGGQVFLASPQADDLVLGFGGRDGQRHGRLLYDYAAFLQ